MEVIEHYGFVFLALAMFLALTLCWLMGANDVANAMGPSVGSRAITPVQALLIASVFELAGAVLLGNRVTETVGRGLVDSPAFTDQPHLLVYGMLAATLAAGSWLVFAAVRGWPVSTTYTIVGAVVGFAVVGIGRDAVEWAGVTRTAGAWLALPAATSLVALTLTLSIRVTILDREDPFECARRWGPIYVFVAGFVITLASVLGELAHLGIALTPTQSGILALTAGLGAGHAGRILINRIRPDPQSDQDFHFASVEKVFTPMMLFTACALAFAHGSNDVANGVAPLMALVITVQSGSAPSEAAEVAVWILLFGAAGIVTGLVTMGYRFISSIGAGFSGLTPSRGFSATFSAATVILIASRLGLPVSTAHIIVGAVLGVGLARGIAAIDLNVIGDMLLFSLVTLVASGTLAGLYFFVLMGVFG